MALSLNNLERPKMQKRRKRRVGRGNASGRGTYAGRGIKGQRARSGGRRGIKRRAAFQQLLIRTPKLRGFKRERAPIATINLSALNEHFSDGDVVSLKSLTSRGLIGKSVPSVKVLGSGTLEKKLIVKANSFSESAKAAIKKAGGTIEVI